MNFPKNIRNAGAAIVATSLLGGCASLSGQPPSSGSPLVDSCTAGDANRHTAYLLADGSIIEVETNDMINSQVDVVLPWSDGHGNDSYQKVVIRYDSYGKHFFNPSNTPAAQNSATPVSLDKLDAAAGEIAKGYSIYAYLHRGDSYKFCSQDNKIQPFIEFSASFDGSATYQNTAPENYSVPYYPGYYPSAPRYDIIIPEKDWWRDQYNRPPSRSDKDKYHPDPRDRRYVPGGNQ